MKRMSCGGALVAAALLAFGATANANTVINWSAAASSYSNIGSTINGGYDYVTISAGSGAFSLANNQSATLVIDPLQFNVGNTGANSLGLHSYTDSRSITINGQSQTLQQPFNVNVGNTVDTLTFNQAPALHFNLGAGGILDVTALGTSLSTGTTANGSIAATFFLHDVPATDAAVAPLPATAWAAMPLLGGVGLLHLRRRKPSNA